MCFTIWWWAREYNNLKVKFTVTGELTVLRVKWFIPLATSTYRVSPGPSGSC